MVDDHRGRPPGVGRFYTWTVPPEGFQAFETEIAPDELRRMADRLEDGTEDPLEVVIWPVDTDTGNNPLRIYNPGSTG